MLEQEIMNKHRVELYDNDLNLLTQGVITKYQHQLGYIVLDYSIIFPIHHIAKITVLKRDSIAHSRLSQL